VGAVDAARAPLGRPRSTEADAAIATAAMAVLAESGFEGVTVEAVAARAGVARSTVYRRFPGKPELLVTVLAHSCQGLVPDPDTGTVVGDLEALASGLQHALTETDLGRALPAIIAASACNPEVAAAHKAFVSQRRTVMLLAIGRGIERGEVAPDVDPDTLADLVVGPIFHRRFTGPRPVSDAWIREIVARAVRACAPTGSQPGGA
jgi:AcrR family transcriptional regulator